MIAVIDSGGANITSVLSAFDRLGVETVFTKSIDDIQNAERVILPGVGTAKDVMARLEEHDLIDVIPKLTQPVFGICVGMQILFNSSEEADTKTLGIIDGTVEKFVPNKDKPVPHMGWNKIAHKSDHPVLQGLGDDPYFYFVHSYAAPVSEKTIGRCNYEDDFTAIVAQDNFVGCQFHPERSGVVGQKILKNFLEMKL